MDRSPAIVAVVKPNRERLSRKAVLAGEFHAYQQVDLHARVAGYLKNISVEAGDRVRQGQVLAVLEIPEMDADLAQAAAMRSRAEAELVRGRAELQRAKVNLSIEQVSYDRLVKAAEAEKGLIAQQDLDAALAKKNAAEAHVASSTATIDAADRQVEAARAAEERMRLLKEYTRLVAPFAGLITKRYVDTGAMIQAGTSSSTAPVVRLAEIDRVRFVALAPESTAPLLRPGQPVEVRVTALNRMVPARVSRINGSIQFSSRTMEVEIDLDNRNADLLPGMQGQAVTTISHKAETVTVPVQAVINGGGNRFVWVVNTRNEVEERQVRTGMESAASFEILEGLRGDELLIVGNRSLLKPGQVVQAKTAEAL
jgi:RND family efflux transporter MFP subunit